MVRETDGHLCYTGAGAPMVSEATADLEKRKGANSMSETQGGKRSSGDATTTVTVSKGDEAMSGDSGKNNNGEDAPLLVEEEAAESPISEGATEQVEKRLQVLRERIRAADSAYYVNDNPIISDAEYDALMRELRALEEAYPELVLTESPTQHVSGEAAANFTKVGQLTPMIS